MASLWQTITDTLLDLLFPELCAGCNRVGSLFCERCRAALQPYPNPTSSQPPLLAVQPSGAPPLLDAVTVAFQYGGPLRKAIHCLKYERVRRVAMPLAELLAAHLSDHPLPTDALCPVPLHERRLAERGFNQSEELARHLAAHLGVPVLASELARGRDTPQQVGLNAQERRENMQEAFVWVGAQPPPARVLLVDDVMTTGSTLGACAEALRAAGTRSVGAVVLARSRVGSD